MNKLFIFGLIIFQSFALPAQEDDWILKRDREDLKVYYRDSEASKIRELRMVYTLPHSLSSILALLDDVDNYPNWVYKLGKASLVEKVSDKEFFYYNEMDFPWPLDNRDLIAHSVTEQDPETKIVRVHSTSAHWKLNEQEDIVRISDLEIIWIFYPLTDGNTKVDYFLKSDPAGSIPAWLVNLAIDQGPIQTYKNMKKELERPKYKTAQVSYLNK